MHKPSWTILRVVFRDLFSQVHLVGIYLPPIIRPLVKLAKAQFHRRPVEATIPRETTEWQ